MTDIEKLNEIPGTVSYVLSRLSTEQLNNLYSEEMLKPWLLICFPFIFSIEEEKLKRELYFELTQRK